MSLLWHRAADLDEFVPPAPGSSGAPGATVSDSQVMRIGAVWACLRLRADLVSTLPWHVFRDVSGRAVQVPRPPMLTTPASGWLWNEWLYATQFDLDRFGNSFGLVAARDGANRPAQVETTQAQDWSIVMSGKSSAWEYQYRGVPQSKKDVWHERQFVQAGLPFGLSPIAASAITSGHYLSAQQFALDWFQSGASPSGHLRNTKREVDPKDSETLKARFRQTVSRRDVLVTGHDWEFIPAAGAASDAKFLEAISATERQVTQFFGVPGDLIEVDTGSRNITYANVTQRNLQLLTINIGPAIARREARFSQDLVAAPRYVRANTDAMMRMDPRGKLELLTSGVDSMVYTHDEARGLLELEPLTDAQIAKEHQITKPPVTPGTKNGVGQ